MNKPLIKKLILVFVLTAVALGSFASAQQKIDTTGDNFLGGATSNSLIADKDQFMPVFYSLFQAAPGVSASVNGTPIYQNSATSSVIKILRNLTVPARDGSKNPATYVWGFFISLSIYGLLHSGVQMYMRVAREGEPVGNTSLAFLTKVCIVYVMITWVVAAAPRIMIRIVDNLSGLSEGQISAYTAQQVEGNLSDETREALRKEAAKYQGVDPESNPAKWARSIMTPARLQFLEYYNNAKDSLEREDDERLGLTPGTIAEVLSSIEKLKTDYEIDWNYMSDYAALGVPSKSSRGRSGNEYDWSLGQRIVDTVEGKQSWWGRENQNNVTARAKDLSKSLNIAYFPKVYNQVAAGLGNTLQTPLHLSSSQAKTFNGMTPWSDERWEYAMFGRKKTGEIIKERGVSSTDATPDNRAVLLNAFPRSEIDWDAVRLPNKILETALKGACMMLGIAIWGLPLGLLLWSAMYSLPKELNTGGVLTKSVNTILTIVVTGLLLGACFTIAQAVTTDVKWDGIQSVAYKNVASLITSDTIEVILLAGFITATPGIAAKLVQGVNGLADASSKVMESSGRTSALSTLVGATSDVGGSKLGTGLKMAAPAIALPAFAIANALQGKR